MSKRSDSPSIVWFRDDLRLSDHPALRAASDTGGPVICLYVLDEVSAALRVPNGRPLGGAARWWLAQSLRSLQTGLAALGAPLVLRRGSAASVISGHNRLREFLADDLPGYAGHRDRPDRAGTSRLSPHLRFGEVSPRQLWCAGRFAMAESPARAGDVDKFLSELGWREFCRHLLF